MAREAGRGLVESIGQGLTDITREGMRTWGMGYVPPGPLLDFTQASPYLTRGALWNILPEPETVGGIRQAGLEMGSGLSEPGALLAMAIGGGIPGMAKPVQAYFGAGAAMGVPEAARQVWEAETPYEVGKGLFNLIGSGAIALGVGANLVRGGRPAPRTAQEAIRDLIEREEQYATQERLQQEGRVIERQGVGPLRPTPEAGGGYRPEPSPEVGRRAEVAETPQVLLSPEDTQGLRDLGYTAEDIGRMGDVEITNILEQGAPKPEAQTLVTPPTQPITNPRMRSAKRPPAGAQNIQRVTGPQGQVHYEFDMPVDAMVESSRAKVPEKLEITTPQAGELPFSGGNRQIATITPEGSIQINGLNLMSWLRTIEPARWGDAIDSLVFEESNHVKVQKALTKAEREQFWDLLTPAEQLAYSRIYSGKWARMPEGMTKELMGYEALNHFQMRLGRMTPREVVEAARLERWTVQSLELLAKGLYDARRALGTKASGTQAALLDRVINNVNLAKAAATMVGPSVGTQNIENLSKADFGDPLFKSSPKVDVFAGKQLRDGTLMYAREHAAGAMQMTPGKEGYLLVPKRVQDLDPMLFELNEVSFSMDQQAELGLRFITIPELNATKGDLFQAVRAKYPKAAPGAYQKFTPEETERKLRVLDEADAATFDKETRVSSGGLTQSAWNLGLSLTQPNQLSELIAGRMNTVNKIREAQAAGRLAEGFGWVNRGQFWREAYEAATGTGSAGWHFKDDPTVNPPFAQPNWREALIEKARTPEARMKPQQERGQPELFLPPIPKGQAVERGTPLPPTPTAYDLQGRANEYLYSATDQLMRDPKAPLPRYPDFVREMRQAFAASGVRFQPGAVAELWVNSVYHRLINASGALLSELRSRSKLQTKVGDRPIPDPPPRERLKLEQQMTPEARRAARQEEKAIKVGQNYRATVIRAIAEKLTAPALRERPSLERRTVLPEDISLDPETTQPVFHAIDKSVMDNPTYLQKVLAEDARVSGENVSTTKRLTVLQHRETGDVFMVSTFREGRKGVMLMEPMGPKPILLEKILENYRPVFSVLLDQPVKDFSQRFKSLGEWERQFGTEARKASRSLIGEAPRLDYEWTGLKAPSGRESQPPGELIGAPGVIEQLASEEAPPLTPREAGGLIDHLIDTADKVSARQDILDDIERLRMDAEAGKLTHQDLFAISAYAKIYSAIANKWKQLTPDQLYDQMIDEIYEKAQRAKTGDEFEADAVRSYAPEVSEAGRGLPVRPTTATETGARELTMRERLAPTTIRGQQLPARPGPEPRLPEPKPPAKLSEAEVKFLTPEPLPEAIRPGPFRYSITRYAEVPKEPYTLAYKRRLKAEQAIQKEFRAGGEAAPAGTERMPEAIMKHVDSAERLWNRTIGGLFSAYGEWMSERIRTSGKMMSAIAADAFDIIVDGEKRAYGTLTPVLDPARREAGKRGPATTWIQGRTDVTPFAGISRGPEAIEGKIAIPPFAQGLVDLAKTANLAIGRLYESVSAGFTALGLWQRNPTAYGYDLLRRGEGPEWDHWVEGQAVANNVPRSFAESFFKEWKAILDDPLSDQARIEKVNQDFHRNFPRAITHIKVGPLWQEVIHANLFSYLESAARRATHVKAFREVFPNTPSGNKVFHDLITSLRKELDVPYQLDLDAMVRALQGHPSDMWQPTGVFRSTEPLGQFGQLVNRTLGNFFAKLVLTGQMFVQPGELAIGSTPVFLGYRNYVEGLAKVRHLYSAMEIRGEVNRALLDYSWDPNSPVRSAFKIAGNIVSRGFGEQLLNELQEASAAATADVVTNRIRAGTLDSWERSMLPQTFRIMGFTEGQAAAMMRGDQVLLDMFRRRAASFLTSGNKAIAEGSRLGANRLFNSIFRFQSYPMMKSNQLVKTFANVYRNWKAVAEGTGSKKAAVDASRLFGRFILGNLAQGMMTTAITTLFYDGVFAAKIKGQEALDEPGNLSIESFLSAMSGPLYLVWRGAKYGGLGGLGEQAGRMFFPYQVVRELLDAWSASGSYRDLDWQDRAGKFAQMKIPGSRAIAQGMAIFGLHDRNYDLDAAIRAYHRWSMEKFGKGGAPPEYKEDEGKRFRLHAKKAVEAAKRDDWDKYAENLWVALEERGKKGVRASFNARKILRHPTGRKLSYDELTELENHIGRKALVKLMGYDAMLDVLGK